MTFRLTAILAGCILAGWALAADLDALRPSAQWLAKERLKGTLFHQPNADRLRPKLVAPSDPTGHEGPSTPLRLRGWHTLIVLPDRGEIIFRLKAVAAREHFRDCIYAVFDPQGAELATGRVALQHEERVRVQAHGDGPHFIMLNSGPACDNTAEIIVQNPHWSVETKSRSQYDRSPLHYHFLRDLKLGGFNLAMIDVERLAQPFVTDEDLAKWTALVKRWTDYARKHEMRVMIAMDLGGTKYEVDSWGDAPKGLYIKHDENKPLAPCPLQKVYWERILLRRGREVAKLARDNPYVVGYAIDPEMYQCWLYGHYMLGGTCFCDHCLGGFLKSKGLAADVLAEKKTGQERYDWLRQQKLWPEYDKYLEEQTAKMAAWCRDELHAIDPDLLWCVYVLEIGNWFCRGLARGLSRPDLPVVNFCEHTYYSVGYDREWLDKIMDAFKDWGANVLQGSALWDLHFPPTKPGFLPAHIYNLGINAEGWWYWPGDDLYRDRGARYAYLNQPAYFEDYWDACVWGNQEIDRTMQQPGRHSPLDRAEVVPWKGKISSGKITAPEDVLRKYSEPALPLHLGGPARLFFSVPERSETFQLIALARSPDNGATLTVRDAQGREAGRLSGELDQPATLDVRVTQPGLWSIEAQPTAGLAFNDLRLKFEGLPTMVATDPEALLIPPAKKPGLIGYWPLDEGRGAEVADKSSPPPYNGSMRGATWAQGKRGACLQFDGHSGDVSIPVEYPFHNLKAFSLAAWVKLAGLPDKGNGGSLINKGPEAPGQHFWWWIGYPPSYSLILEVGNEKHRWGTSFASKPLKWELGRWYHVAVTFKCADGKSTATLYRDGEQVGQSTKDEAFHSGTHDIRLGTYGALHWLNGCLDEVKIWDRTLTPEEIKADMETAD